MVSGPTFYAWLELAVAARTDPELRPRVATLTQRFMQVIETTFPELFPRPSEPHPLYEVAPIFVFSLMDGLAVGQLHAGDPARAARILDALKALARLVMPPEGES